MNDDSNQKQKNKKSSPKEASLETHSNELHDDIEIDTGLIREVYRSEAPTKIAKKQTEIKIVMEDIPDHEIRGLGAKKPGLLASFFHSIRKILFSRGK